MRPDDPLRNVTHVFMDAGGTILHSEPSFVEIFRKVLGGRGHRINSETMIRGIRSAENVVHLIRPLARSRQAEYFRAYNARVVEHMGIPSEDTMLEEIRVSFDRAVWRPFPETVPVLKALKAEGFRLGVISNASHRLPEIIEEAGLAVFMDTITYSFDIGADKPHPRIFRRALADAGATSARSLHVGDSFEADYVGARAAGLHAVLLQREGDPPAPCPHIRSLTELLDLVRPPRSRA